MMEKVCGPIPRNMIEKTLNKDAEIWLDMKGAKDKEVFFYICFKQCIHKVGKEELLEVARER